MADNRLSNVRLCLCVAVTALALPGCGGGGITPIRTHFNKGVYLYSNGDVEQAIREYRLALDESPDDYRARFNLAIALETQAQRKHSDERARVVAEAEQEYREVLRQRPENLRAAINLAAIEMERGDREQAMQRLERAATENPRAAEPLAAMGAHLLADDSLVEAEHSLRKALQRNSADPMANALLGECLFRLGQYEQAANSYRNAIRADAADIASLIGLGRVELARDAPAEAAGVLQRALLIDGDNCSAHLLLADALERLDDLEGAAYHLWRVRMLSDRTAPETQSEQFSEHLIALYERLIERERRAAAESLATP